MQRPLLNCLAVTVCLCSGLVVACQTPVFRYALERWKAGTWKIVVLSEGPLSPDQSKALQELEKSADTATTANNTQLDVQHIDLETAAPADRRRWLSVREVAGSDRMPVAAAVYPQPATVDQPIASLMKFSAAAPDLILASPARSELASRLSKGHSAVWLFLESGNQQADQEAFERLNSQLQQDEKRLKLPAVAELQLTPELLQRIRVPLKLHFSIIRLSRDDPRETFLVDTLLNCEADLRELSEPMAFPVFGRGRVLYALVGKGIDAKTVAEASDFLAGPCSCQVKEQNPGFDLLLIHHWDAAVGSTLISSPIPQEQQTPKLLIIPPGRATEGKAEK